MTIDAIDIASDIGWLPGGIIKAVYYGAGCNILTQWLQGVLRVLHIRFLSSRMFGKICRHFWRKA